MSRPALERLDPPRVQEVAPTKTVGRRREDDIKVHRVGVEQPLDLDTLDQSDEHCRHDVGVHRLAELSTLESGAERVGQLPLRVLVPRSEPVLDRVFREEVLSAQYDMELDEPLTTTHVVGQTFEEVEDCRAAYGRQRRCGGQVLLPAPLDDCEQQLELGAEMMPQSWLRDPDPGSDGCETGSAIAIACEELHGGIQDLLAPPPATLERLLGRVARSFGHDPSVRGERSGPAGPAGRVGSGRSSYRVDVISRPPHTSRTTLNRGHQRRRDIIEAAADLFAANGYRGTGLAAIADRVGVTQPTVLHHFGSKAGLLLALLDHLGEADDPAVGRPSSLEARLSDTLPLIAARIRSDRRRAHLMTVLVAENLLPEAPAHEWFVRNYDRHRRAIADVLRAAQVAGSVRASDDADILATQVMAVVDGLEALWIRDPQAIDLEAVLEEFGLMWDADLTS